MRDCVELALGVRDCGCGGDFRLAESMRAILFRSQFMMSREQKSPKSLQSEVKGVSLLLQVSFKFGHRRPIERTR